MANWTFICVSDIHVGTPRSFRYQQAWRENWLTARRQILEMSPDLILVAGDMTRDGCTHRFELEQIKADLDELPFPAYCIPGNHDVGDKIPVDSTPETNKLWGTRIRGEFVELYRSVFGPSQWMVEHRGVRFSGFNALLAGSGLPEEAAMWQWLEAQAKRPPATRHVWVMHPALFVHDVDEPNYPPNEGRASYFGVDRPHRDRMLHVFRRTCSYLGLSGHLHARRQVNVDDITFQYAPSTAFVGQELWPEGDTSLGFLRCDVSDAGIEVTFIPLARTSDATGYGPGGNPPLEGRDYTVAWEKPALDLDEQRLPRGVAGDGP